MAKLSYDFLVSEHKNNDIFDRKGIVFDYVLKIPVSYLNLPREITRILDSAKSREGNSYVNTFRTLGDIINYPYEKLEELMYVSLSNLHAMKAYMLTIEENLARFGLKIKETRFTTFDVRVTSLNLNHKEKALVEYLEAKNISDLHANLVFKTKEIDDDFIYKKGYKELYSSLKDKCRAYGAKFININIKVKKTKNTKTKTSSYYKYFPDLLPALEAEFGNISDSEDGKKVYLIYKDKNGSNIVQDKNLLELIKKRSSTKKLEFIPSAKFFEAKGDIKSLAIDELGICGTYAKDILENMDKANIKTIGDLMNYDGALTNLVSQKIYNTFIRYLNLTGVRSNKRFYVEPDAEFLNLSIEQKKEQPIKALGIKGTRAGEIIAKLNEVGIINIADFNKLGYNELVSLGINNVYISEIGSNLRAVGLSFKDGRFRHNQKNEDINFNPSKELLSINIIGEILEQPIESLGFGGSKAESYLAKFKEAGINQIRDINSDNVKNGKIFSNDEDFNEFVNIIKILGVNFLTNPKFKLGLYGTSELFVTNSEQRSELPIEKIGFVGMDSNKILTRFKNYGIEKIGDFENINRGLLIEYGFSIAQVNKIINFFNDNNIKYAAYGDIVEKDGKMIILNKKDTRCGFWIVSDPKFENMDTEQIIEQPIESLNFKGRKAEKYLKILKNIGINQIKDFSNICRQDLILAGIGTCDLIKIKNLLSDFGVDMVKFKKTEKIGTINERKFIEVQDSQKSYVNATIGDGVVRFVPPKTRKTLRESILFDEVVSDNEIRATEVFRLLDEKGAAGLYEIDSKYFRFESEYKEYLKNIFNAYINDLSSNLLRRAVTDNDVLKCRIYISNQIDIAKEIFNVKNVQSFNSEVNFDLDEFIKNTEKVCENKFRERFDENKNYEITEIEVQKYVASFKSTYTKRISKFHHSANGWVNVLSGRVKQVRMNYNGNENSIAEENDLFNMQK